MGFIRVLKETLIGTTKLLVSGSIGVGWREKHGRDR
jgi:hypothetical protein